MRVRIITALPLLMALAAGGCGGKSGNTVVFGVAGPLSKANGHSMQLAAEMAVAEINANGGIKGDSLRLVFADDSADEARAIEVARQLRENPQVSAVVGHVNSKATLAAAGIYNGASSGSLKGSPVLEISPASSAPELTRAGAWTFRLCPTDLEFSPVMARWALGTLGKRRAAVLYANDQYGNGVYTTF